MPLPLWWSKDNADPVTASPYGPEVASLYIKNKAFKVFTNSSISMDLKACPEAPKPYKETFTMPIGELSAIGVI